MTNQNDHTKARVLICAYACSPGKGSEESVGWDTTAGITQAGIRTVVLTRSSEKEASEKEATKLDQAVRPIFVSYDLHPKLSMLFNRIGKLGVELGYLLWLRGARETVRSLHLKYRFTSTQHVTYARYWMPSPLTAINVPFMWGPVGGGESIPVELRESLSFAGRVFEWIRDGMRYLGERLPETRLNAEKCHTGFANTSETARRMKQMGARKIEILNSAALSDRDIQHLQSKQKSTVSGLIQFASVGRLLDWKGFHLGLRAFAEARMHQAEYLIVGSGPAKARLQKEAIRLEIDHQVQFIDTLPRQEFLDMLSSVHALVHPSLHESGGYVVLEAMAAETAVICVNAGGPALFVDNQAGFICPVNSEEVAVYAMAGAMKRVHAQSRSGNSARTSSPERVKSLFSISAKTKRLVELHSAVAQKGQVRDQQPARSERARSERTPSKPGRIDRFSDMNRKRM